MKKKPKQSDKASLWITCYRCVLLTLGAFITGVAVCLLVMTDDLKSVPVWFYLLSIVLLIFWCAAFWVGRFCSNKKRTAIIIVCLIGVAGVFFRCYHYRMEDRGDYCIRNQRDATIYVASYLGCNGLDNRHELIPKEVFDWYKKDVPTCPYGGAYIWADILWDDGKPRVRCNNPDHQPTPEEMIIR